MQVKNLKYMLIIGVFSFFVFSHDILLFLHMDLELYSYQKNSPSEAVFLIYPVKGMKWVGLYF